MISLYCDGGCIGSNPSILGGTWAYRVVTDGRIIKKGKGYLFPKDIHSPTITNNQTELYAVIQGLKALTAAQTVRVCSDSSVTLGRLFHGWSFTNIPESMISELKQQQSRLTHYKHFTPILMYGHPNQKMLKNGNVNGRPVSHHQVWCDEMCQLLAREYKEQYEYNQPALP